MKDFKSSVLKHMLIVLATLLMLLTTSCDDVITCGQLYTDRNVKLAFSKVLKSKYADTVPSNLSAYIIKNEMLTRDTLFLYKDTTAGQISVALSQVNDTSSLFLKINKNTDTLRFVFERNLELVSADCGFNTRYKFVSLAYTHHAIDTILNTNTTVSKDIDKNFEIVLYPKNISTTDTTDNHK